MKAQLALLGLVFVLILGCDGRSPKGCDVDLLQAWRVANAYEGIEFHPQGVALRATIKTVWEISWACRGSTVILDDRADMTYKLDETGNLVSPEQAETLIPMGDIGLNHLSFDYLQDLDLFGRGQ